MTAYTLAQALGLGAIAFVLALVFAICLCTVSAEADKTALHEGATQRENTPHLSIVREASDLDGFDTQPNERKEIS